MPLNEIAGGIGQEPDACPALAELVRRSFVDRDVETEIAKEVAGSQSTERPTRDRDPRVGNRHLGRGFAEGGNPVDVADEQHPTLIERRVAKAVGGLVAGVLRPDLVELSGDLGALNRVIFENLTLDVAVDLSLIHI